MNRVVLIERIEEARTVLEKLLTLLQLAPSERDRFVSHLYQSRREYRRTCETAGKSGQANRAVRHLKLPNCGKHGFQVRLSPMGALLRVGD